MATLNKPGPFDCMAKLKRRPDMPFFLLLPSDPDASKTVRDWAVRRGQRPDPKGKAAQAYEVAGQMDAWRVREEAEDTNDTCRWPLPFGEEVTHGWQWLTGSWGGGLLCGVIATLGLFLVKVTA